MKLVWFINFVAKTPEYLQQEKFWGQVTGQVDDISPIGDDKIKTRFTLIRDYDIDRSNRVEEHTEKQINTKAGCVSAKSPQVDVTFIFFLLEEAPYLDHALDKYDARNYLADPNNVVLNSVTPFARRR